MAIGYTLFMILVCSTTEKHLGKITFFIMVALLVRFEKQKVFEFKMIEGKAGKRKEVHDEARDKRSESEVEVAKVHKKIGLAVLQVKGAHGGGGGTGRAESEKFHNFNPILKKKIGDKKKSKTTKIKDEDASSPSMSSAESSTKASASVLSGFLNLLPTSSLSSANTSRDTGSRGLSDADL